VEIARNTGEQPMLVSVEELLGEGQGKSGAHGVPFSYSFFDDTRLRELTFYVHDHLGNTRVTYTVGCDGSNGAGHLRTLEHAVDYFPYGSILREFVNSTGPEKYLTTHHERDQETGLDYRGARYYDSDVARFLSLDPLAADYASWSPYNYVLGNPIRLVDPDGRSAECGCPVPPCGEVVQRLESMWNVVGDPLSQISQSMRSGLADFGSWLGSWGEDGGGATMTSDYATGSNNSDRKGKPSDNWDVTAVEVRANATHGPENLSPVKAGLGGKWMQQLHDIVSPAAGATQEVLNPTPEPLIVAPKVRVSIDSVGSSGTTLNAVLSTRVIEVSPKDTIGGMLKGDPSRPVTPNRTKKIDQ
jgi:RHS repeat-associated protein